MSDLRPFAAVLTALLALSCGAAQAQSQAPDTVEEDWVLVAATPDVPAVGPQITTCMCPVADKSAPFVAFDLNYREYPSFQPGGMQVQAWAGNTLVSAAGQGTAQMNTPNETITWTQRMSVSNGVVAFKVKNGQSTTWGAFGAESWRLLVSYTTPLNSMAGYSPDNSVARSGASWESNLVASLTLVQVRYYANGSLIATDTTPRSVTLGN